jgi:hypothetical protein
MRRTALILLCLIVLAALSSRPSLHDRFSATHLPNDPVAMGINTEKSWRKSERSKFESPNEGQDDFECVSFLLPGVCQQSQRARYEYAVMASRVLDHVRLARAPPAMRGSQSFCSDNKMEPVDGQSAYLAGPRLLCRYCNLCNSRYGDTSSLKKMLGVVGACRSGRCRAEHAVQMNDRSGFVLQTG